MSKQSNIPQLRFKGFDGEWKENSIGDVLKIGSGKDYKHLEFGTIPVYGTGGYMTSVNKELYSGETVFIGRKGTIDKPFYFNGSFWTVDTLFYTHKFKNILPLFVFGIFQKINWKLHNEASGVPSLSKSTIEKIKISIPTLPEQEKIASFLSAVDEKIQQLTRKTALLEQYKKGVMQQLFSGKLRFKDENGEEYVDWEEKKLGDVATKKSSNISANKIEDNFGDFIIYGASGILKKVDFYKEENDYISIVKDGAGVGRLLYCKGKSSVLGTMEIISPKQNIDTYFLFCLLSNIDFTKYITGSTIPHIYFKDYSIENCGIPSLPEQQKIAGFLSGIDEKIGVIKCELGKMQGFKKGLLQKMFVS